MSKRWLITPLALSLLLTAACASTGGSDSGKDSAADGKADDGDTPEQVASSIKIASVQLIEDCPDPTPPPAEPAPDIAEPSAKSQAKPMPPAKPQEPPSAGAPARPMDMEDVAAGDSEFAGGYPDFCTQSTIQLELATEGDKAADVTIKAIRLLAKDGKPVGELAARLPTAWDENGYSPWDQALEPGEPVKASYKLSAPDWSAVEKSIGENSFGYMFRLEVDVEIGGVTQTVQSPEVPREEPEVIVT